MTGTELPTLITALATLVTAVAGLIMAFRSAGAANVAAHKAAHTAVKVDQVAEQTNGVVKAMQERLSYLEHEMAGTAHRAKPRLEWLELPTGPTSAPQ